MDFFKKMGDGFTSAVAPLVGGSSQQPWKCAACTYANVAEASTCGMCGVRKGSTMDPSQADVAARPISMMPMEDEPMPLGGDAPSPPVASSAKWACGTCTFENERSATSCEICGAPNPNGNAAAPPVASSAPSATPAPPRAAPAPAPPPAPPPPAAAAAAAPWTCPTCTLENVGPSPCAACGGPSFFADFAVPQPPAGMSVRATAAGDYTQPAPPPPVPAWPCVACTFRNGAGASSCGACGTPYAQGRSLADAVAASATPERGGGGVLDSLNAPPPSERGGGGVLDSLNPPRQPVAVARPMPMAGGDADTLLPPREIGRRLHCAPRCRRTGRHDHPRSYDC